jgi:uncharacterized protein YgiM (DUF1202 family)
MNKDTIIRVASIVGVLGVLYFLYKKVSNSSSDGQSYQDTKDEETTTTTDSGFSKFNVTTKTTSLNIRQNPDDKSKIIGKLNKGQEVLLKASTTNGWMEYSTNGTTTFGYVSSAFVTKA